LQRVGGKYPSLWHVRHMDRPASTTPGSVMPAYTHLKAHPFDTSLIGSKMRALRTVGVPYTDGEIESAPASIAAQAKAIVAEVEAQQGPTRDGHQVEAPRLRTADNLRCFGGASRAGEVAMLQELAAQTGASAWAIGSMIFFVVAWVAIAVWVARTRPEDLDARARLALEGDADAGQEVPPGTRTER
jgi:hypothetical protein